MGVMYEKYGQKVVDFVDSLIGTYQMGTPDGEWYGIEEDDIDEVLVEFEDIVYACGCCGWMCDGNDRYESKEFDMDICSTCKEDEDYV